MKYAKKKLSFVKNELRVSLKEVTRLDCEFLYELLKSRNPSVNISHKKLPTYYEHVKFVLEKPYSKWYIIKYNERRVGSIYLSLQDEIGIFIKKEFQRRGIGKKAVLLLMKKNPRSRYLANVAPENIKHQKFFKKLGFLGLEYTYELIKSDDEK